MGSQARSLIDIRFLHPAKVKTNLASALSLNENVGINTAVFSPWQSTSKLALLIWLNENVFLLAVTPIYVGIFYESRHPLQRKPI